MLLPALQCHLHSETNFHDTCTASWPAVADSSGLHSTTTSKPERTGLAGLPAAQRQRRQQPPALRSRPSAAGTGSTKLC